MKQVLQNLRTGKTELGEVPAPQVRRGELVIRTRVSLISSGTEKMMVDFGRANLLQKAIKQPQRVKRAIEKVSTEGLMPTIDAIRNRLEARLRLGYCNVGEVLEVGTGVEGFNVGDRVASNGFHAEIVNVAKNLCVKVPDGVSDESASFTVIGAIALQGIRLAEPTLGERFVVIGLGMIGLTAIQLLRAQGCRVIGLDLDPVRVSLAAELGADAHVVDEHFEPEKLANRYTDGVGVDGVLITASTNSNAPVSHAARMCRKRGRIILIGVTGPELSRDEFYEKELSFQVSCSYGPGRYDVQYEQNGIDYPIGFVRWTENRNMQAILNLLESELLDLKSLITHRVAFAEAPVAYEILTNDKSAMGIVLEYETEHLLDSEEVGRTVELNRQTGSTPCDGIVSFIGAGNYAASMLLPAFEKAGAQFHTIVSQSGISATRLGKRFGFLKASTDSTAAIESSAVDTVVIATRHDTHCTLMVEAINNGKHVFVEKPLCLSLEELSTIESAISSAADNNHIPLVMVGFNRRFSPLTVKVKSLLSEKSEPKAFLLTVNAGAIPSNHWVHDRAVGGGRIVGEGCHFIDLLRFLANSPIQELQTATMSPVVETHPPDKAMVTLKFENGSIGSIHYLANGHRRVSKERLEVFCDGSILQMDNFISLKGHGWPGFSKMELRRQDKGQSNCAAAFMQAVRTGGPAPIPVGEIIEVSRASIEASSS